MRQNAHWCTNAPSHAYLCTCTHTPSLCIRSVAGTKTVYSHSPTQEPDILTTGDWERAKQCHRLFYMFIFAKSQHVSLATKERQKKAEKLLRFNRHSLKSAFPRLFDHCIYIYVSMYYACVWARHNVFFHVCKDEVKEKAECREKRVHFCCLGRSKREKQMGDKEAKICTVTQEWFQSDSDLL